MYRQELLFLWSACRLMMLYSSMKFHENILNGFKLWSRQEFTTVEFQRSLTTKLLIRVTVLVLCMSSDDALYFYEVSRKYRNVFQLQSGHKMTIVKFQWGITTKLYR